MSCLTSCAGASPGCLGIFGFFERSFVGETSGARAVPCDWVVVGVVSVSVVACATCFELVSADGMSAGLVESPQPARAARARMGARNRNRRMRRVRLAPRAGEGTRTPDPRLTRALLYQLSYSGGLPPVYGRAGTPPPPLHHASLALLVLCRRRARRHEEEAVGVLRLRDAALGRRLEQVHEDVGLLADRVAPRLLARRAPVARVGGHRPRAVVGPDGHPVVVAREDPGAERVVPV